MNELYEEEKAGLAELRQSRDRLGHELNLFKKELGITHKHLTALDKNQET